MNAHSLWLRLRALAAPRRAERELREELEFHIEMQARKHLETGMAPDEAMRRARRSFGNLELAKEDARDVRGVRPLEDTVRDIRYALRGLRRSPGFALSVIATIGLGVGVTTSAFTVFNAYVLRPFDVRDPNSLYSVQWQDRAGHVRDFSASEIDVLRGRGSPFEDVTAFQTFTARLRGLSAVGDAVCENYFTLLGVRASIGRTFLPEDRSLAVLVLGNDAWRTRFGGDSTIVGRRVLVHGHSFEIIGVAKPGFAGLFKKPRDFWIPLGSLAQVDSSAANSGTMTRQSFSVIGRVAHGASEAQAAAFVSAQLRAATAVGPDSARFMRALLSSRSSAIPRTLTSYVTFAPLVIAFGLVLILACANVANMLLARGLARQRELGVRLALGAARTRLIRQLVIESVVLAVPSIGIGFALAWLVVDLGVRTLFATIPADLATFVRLVPLVPDYRVALFSLFAAVGSAFAFGLIPAMQTTRLSLVQATRGVFAHQGSPSRLRNLLVVGQITVASLLLIVAGMLLREASRLGSVDSGLRTHDVLSVEPEAQAHDAVLASLHTNPLVAAIATAKVLPLDMKFPMARLAPSGDEKIAQAMYNEVSPSYFDVLGIRLTSGRGFTSLDEAGSGPTVIVSDATAHRLWPSASPLGQTLRLKVTSDTESIARYQNAKVVGTVRDVVVNSVDMGNEQTVLYFPASSASADNSFLIRVKGDPSIAKRTIDADLERDTPGGVDRIDRLETFVVGGMYPYRVAYWIALILGVMALGLTAVGVYGVVAFVVGQRTREISIRVALGATTRDILELVLRQAVRHAVTGVAIGAALAVGAGRVIASGVHGMPVFDLFAFAGASTCVFVVCLYAAFVPSERATKTDPNAALRYD